MDYQTKEQLEGALRKPSKEIFDDLAISLMRNFAIVNGQEGVEYRIAELEYYLYNQDHPDSTVYKRDCTEGQFFFHGDGIDIAFKTDIKKMPFEKGSELRLTQYGGILVRGLLKIKDGKVVDVFGGPQNCMLELCNTAKQFPSLIPAPHLADYKIYATERVQKEKGNYEGEKYRYFFEISDREREVEQLRKRYRKGGDVILLEKFPRVYQNPPIAIPENCIE